MAIERVEKQLRKFTLALDAAGIPYAVVGGNAVAAWVSTVDPDATRSTKDVDILVRRADLSRVAEAVRAIDMVLQKALGVYMFVEQTEPSPKRGVDLIFAEEPVRTGDRIMAPSVTAACRSSQGYMVVNLPELVRMKLAAFRLRDQTHLVDMLSIGLIDAGWTDKLPAELQPRFRQVLEAYQREKQPWA